MKTYFVFSDVHGFYTKLQETLIEVGFDIDNQEHIIISCGDLLDRGNEPMQCLEFVNFMYSQGRAILIRGNHEDLIEDLFQRGEFESHDYHNGTAQTCIDLVGDITISDADEIIPTASQNKLYKEYSSHLIDYYELGKYVFVHGWIPCHTNYKTYKKEPIPDWKVGSWSKARWENGMEAWSDGVRLDGKTIVCGHWHTSWGHSVIDGTCKEFSENKEEEDFSPFIHEGICAIDACTAYSGKVNVYVIEEDKIDFNV